ncbi:MAG: MFS transporter [Candidatus Doudnabacteria bacterium]|nr:MFS transporter [Candidatus Doudnabacteria bacterium]
MTLTVYLSVLKNTNFTKLWVSQVCSQLTNFLLSFAILIKAFRLTESSASVSIILVAFGLATLLFGAFAGVYADRFDRKWILTIINFSQAIIVLVFLFYENNFWALALLTFVYSALNQFYLPAEAPSIPDLVSKDELLVANGYFAFTTHASMLLGFALAGPMVAFGGFKAPFIVGFVLLLIAGTATLLLPSLKPKSSHPGFLKNVWPDFRDGLRYFTGHKVLHFPLVALIFAQIINGMLITLAPALVDKLLGINLEKGTFFAIAPLGLGVITGALILGYESRILDRHNMIITGFIGKGLALASLAAIAFFPSRLTFYVVAAFVAGIFNAHIFSPAHSIMQSEAVDSHRGRVYAALYVLLQAAATLPSFIAGIMADSFSLQVVFLGMGLMLLFAAALLTKFWGWLRYKRGI